MMTPTCALTLEETMYPGAVREQQVILMGKVKGVVPEEAACEQGV